MIDVRCSSSKTARFGGRIWPLCQLERPTLDQRVILMLPSPNDLCTSSKRAAASLIPFIIVPNFCMTSGQFLKDYTKCSCKETTCALGTGKRLYIPDLALRCRTVKPQNHH